MHLWCTFISIIISMISGSIIYFNIQSIDIINIKLTIYYIIYCRIINFY